MEQLRLKKIIALLTLTSLFWPFWAQAQVSIQTTGASLDKQQKLILEDGELEILLPAGSLPEQASFNVENLPATDYSVTEGWQLQSKIFQIDATKQPQTALTVTLKTEQNGDFDDAIYYWQNGWQRYTETVKIGTNQYQMKVDSLPVVLAVLESQKITKVYEAAEIKSGKKISAGAINLWLPNKPSNALTTLEIEKISPTSTPDDLVSDVFAYHLSTDGALGITTKNPLTILFNYSVNNYFGKEIKYYSTTTDSWVPLKSVNDPADHEVAAKTALSEAILGVFNQKKIEEGVASWYAFKGCKCAASRTYPKGTKLKITNLANNKSVIVKVNDTGPEEWTGRLVDLDKVAFKAIASLSSGLISVAVEKVK